MKTFRVKVSDIPSVPTGYTQAYREGIKATIKRFKDITCSHQFNDEIIKLESETDLQYQARLRDLCVELMSSNRGWASCFSEFIKT